MFIIVSIENCIFAISSAKSAAAVFVGAEDGFVPFPVGGFVFCNSCRTWPTSKLGRLVLIPFMPPPEGVFELFCGGGAPVLLECVVPTCCVIEPIWLIILSPVLALY